MGLEELLEPFFSLIIACPLFDWVSPCPACEFQQEPEVVALLKA